MKQYILLLSTLVWSGLSFSQCAKPTPDYVLPLTEDEAADLVFVREEEKLARDVYQFCLSQYKTSVFNNISSSEQTHMDRIKVLLDRYGIEDPVKNNAQGVFQNTDLQALYNQLTAQASLSLGDAFSVGALIEDLDIADIERLKKNTDKPDILAAYGSLVCGSENHMRAFTRQLTRLGLRYVPKYISLERFEGILDGQQGPCMN